MPSESFVSLIVGPVTVIRGAKLLTCPGRPTYYLEPVLSLVYGQLISFKGLALTFY